MRDERLVPATPEPAASQTQLSVLQAELKSGGDDEALAHYQKAANNVVAGQHEAADGQTRSFLESLFIALCSNRTERAFGDAPAALQHLRNKDWLDDKEWNHLRISMLTFRTAGRIMAFRRPTKHSSGFTMRHGGAISPYEGMTCLAGAPVLSGTRSLTDYQITFRQSVGRPLAALLTFRVGRHKRSCHRCGQNAWARSSGGLISLGPS